MSASNLITNRFTIKRDYRQILETIDSPMCGLCFKRKRIVSENDPLQVLMNEESSLGSNPGASCFLWGRFNVAFTNKCPDLSKIASITTFVERICFLKLGFFLELKGWSLTSSRSFCDPKSSYAHHV